MTSYISFKDVLEQPVQTVLVDDYDVEEHLSGQLCDIVDIPRNFKNNGSIKLHFLKTFVMMAVESGNCSMLHSMINLL